MKTNELRIGNYLSGKQGHVTVTEIRANNMVKIHNNTSSFYVGTCLEPIEIDSEWLERFSFNCIFTHDDHHYYNGFLALDRDFQPFDYDIKYEIKHVHQLQNLYFALTGDELTIKC